VCLGGLRRVHWYFCLRLLWCGKAVLI